MTEQGPHTIHTTIEVYCSWCGKYLGTKEGYGTTGISHGMCPECLERESKKIQESRKKGKIKIQPPWKGPPIELE